MSDAVQELNLVPYLDVVVNLMLFVLLTMTLMGVGSINATAPHIETPGVIVGDPKVVDQRAAGLDLLVTITNTGFYVSGNGSLVANPVAAALGMSAGYELIPVRKGDHDLAALSDSLVKIKDAFPFDSTVIIFAESDIPYELVVRTLDATRERSGRLLFPDVIFNALLQ